MRTRSAGQPATESLGGGTGVQIGRGGRRGRRPREGNDERVDDLNGQGNAQGMGANGGVEGVNGNVEGVNRGVGGVGNQGNVGNQNGNVVNENVQENVRNVLVNGNRVGCSYKEFLACNPKEYDGKGGAVVLTRWIEKMENVQDMSGCSNDQKVKYTAGSFVGKALTWWNSQIRTLSQEVAVSMSWNDFKFMMIEEFCPSHEMQKLETELWNHAMVGAGHAAYTNRFHELARLVPHLVTPESRKIKRYISVALTDEAIRNGSIKKVEKRGNVGGHGKDKNGRDDNKRTRTGNAFATTANPVGRENAGIWPKCTTCNSYHAPGGPCRTCFNCNRPGHLAKDCRGVPRNVNPANARNPTVRACYECGSTDHVRSACPRLNRAQGPGGNHPNQVVANNEGQGRGNQGNQARGRAFMLGAEEARQDPNIVTGTFTLNDHFATTLFDSGADYSFVSTTFIPLLGIEPSELGFRYEIEFASKQLIEIDKVTKDCKLEIKGHVFDIDLIPFGHGSFDVIIVEHGPLIWPTVEENGVTRTKKYVELSAAEKIQADCDMKATNIILQGLPADIYSLERECKLYDAFDKFTHINRESLHKYYLRFTQLINDMNIYNMKMEQFQVNTKFINSLPPEWSKFVTDVKLVKDLHTTNFDQLHAYLEQHELHVLGIIHS
ncbi:putative reverse transcriptase domain-containing protein [Tanacetum coccineum]